MRSNTIFLKGLNGDQNVVCYKDSRDWKRPTAPLDFFEK